MSAYTDMKQLTDLGDAMDLVKSMTDDQKANLRMLLDIRINDEFTPHLPHAPQQVFLGLNNREALYGGAAGGGKSDALLIAALQYVDIPGYSALILRRSWQDLSLPGAIMDRANTWLQGTRAKRKDGGRVWTFPSGARITFGYIGRSGDRDRYASAEYQLIAFDELTHFSEDDYTFMFSRLRKPELTCVVCGRRIMPTSVRKEWRHEKRIPVRSPRYCGRAVPDLAMLAEYGPAADGMRLFDVPLRMRSASNPGGRGHAWVRDHFVLPDRRKKGAIFVPALLDDNPSLNRDEYRKSLLHLSSLQRERLLNGNWDVAEEGTMFQRQWWQIVESKHLIPHNARYIRAWDFAATEKKQSDYTVGVLMAAGQGADAGRYWVVDVVRGQWSPDKVEKVVAAIATQDGKKTMIVAEQEPGSSGVMTMDHIRRKVVPGYHFKSQRATGDKASRAMPVSAAVEAGNVMLIQGAWIDDLLDEAVLFPMTGDHDDQVDALALAYNSHNAGGRLLV